MNENIEKRLQRMEAIYDINNLMGRRAFMHSAGQYAKELNECWVRQTPGMAFEIEEFGVWDGRESIWKAYVDCNPAPLPGQLIEHTVTTAVIEVAADCLTAKGVWISPGHETFPGLERPLPHWSWGRYGVDFVKEDGEWKIWHLHIYTTFRTPYEQDWVDSSINRPAHFPPLGEPHPGLPSPDRPITFNQPYSVDKSPVLQPVPPEPYQTFEKTWSYTDEQK